MPTVGSVPESKVPDDTVGLAGVQVGQCVDNQKIVMISLRNTGSMSISQPTIVVLAYDKSLSEIDRQEVIFIQSIESGKTVSEHRVFACDAKTLVMSAWEAPAVGYRAPVNGVMEVSFTID